MVSVPLMDRKEGKEEKGTAAMAASVLSVRKQWAREQGVSYT